MKRTLILIFFLFSLSVRVTAQVTLAKPIKFVTSNPTVCSGNFQYNNTTTGDIFERLGSSGTACTKIVNASATSIVNNAPSGNLPVSAGPPTLNDSGIAAVKGAANNLSITGGSTGNPVILSATGSNDNVALRVNLKGYDAITDTGLSYLLISPNASVPAGTIGDVLGGALWIEAEQTKNANIYIRQAGSSAGFNPNYNLMMSRGTLAVPTASQSGDNNGQVMWYAYDGANWGQLAAVEGFVDAAVGAGSTPGRLWFTTSNGAGLQLGLEINSAQKVTVPQTLNVGSLSVSQAVFTDASKNLVSKAVTGSGSVVLGTSPNITTPTGIVKGDVGLGNVANVDTTSAANISSGTLPNARIVALPLTALATQAADTAVVNATGGVAAPTTVAIGSCSAGTSALTYNTTTHAFGCNSISGSPFADNAALVKNNGDNTKLGIFDVSLVTSGTTRTYKFLDANGSIPIAPTAGPITFAGPTAARTVTLPDANFTAARTDASNTFTGAQGINGPIIGGVTTIHTGTNQNIIVQSHVTPTTGITIQSVNDDNNAGQGLEFRGSDLVFAASGVAAITVNSSQAITLPGIISITNATDSSSSSTGALVVSGGAAINKRVFIPGISASAGLQTAVLCQSSGGEMIADSVACLASSLRYKDGVHDLAGGLIEVMKLRPVSFTYKPEGIFATNPTFQRERPGLIAEEVNLIDPRLVGFEKDGVTPRTVGYDLTVPILIKAVQELNIKFESYKRASETKAVAQQKEIDALKGRP